MIGGTSYAYKEDTWNTSWCTWWQTERMYEYSTNWHVIAVQHHQCAFRSFLFGIRKAKQSFCNALQETLRHQRNLCCLETPCCFSIFTKDSTSHLSYLFTSWLPLLIAFISCIFRNIFYDIVLLFWLNTGCLFIFFTFVIQYILWRQLFL